MGVLYIGGLTVYNLAIFACLSRPMSNITSRESALSKDVQIVQ